MRRVTDGAMVWTLRIMPIIIFVMGCVADAVLNSAIHGPQADRFLPEICGMTVGMLTVLTFARRRQAYLAAGLVFVFVEMVAVTLPLSLVMRATIGGVSLTTAAASLLVYTRGAWAMVRVGYAEER